MSIDVENANLLDRILNRAVEQIGDITPFVMAHFYALYPAARDSFEWHAVGDRPRLEGRMIENSLFCLMNLLPDQLSVEIILMESVPHHHDVLEVPAEWYRGLIEAVVEVLAQQAADDDERRLLSSLMSMIDVQIEQSRAFFHSKG